MEPKDYKAVRAWGHYLGSYEYFIHAEQETAFKQAAPIDALYYSTVEQRWITKGDLATDHRFHEYMAALEERGYV